MIFGNGRKKATKMNVLRTIETIVKEGDEEVEVHAPGHVPCEPTRLTEEEAEERGWAVPTRFDAKGVSITKLEVCTESWVIEMVWCKFQHWSTTECPGEVSKFVKNNKSKFLASLDREGSPEMFHGDQKQRGMCWHM